MAALTGEVTSTTGAVYIPEKWSDLVIKFREANLKAANFFERRDQDISDSGDTIHFPLATTHTAVEYTEGQQLEDLLQANTETEVEMDIDEYWVNPFVVSDRLAKQSQYDQKAINYRAAGYAIATNIDSALLALSDEFTNTAVNAAGTAISNLDLTDCQYQLDALNVPEEDRMWFLHPVCIKDLMDLTGDYFTSSDFTGANAVSSGKIAGLVGMMLGSPVCKTTNVPTSTTGSPATTYYENVYAHKEAIGCAMQITPEVQEKADINLQGVLCNVRALYGLVTLRADHGIVLNR